MTRGGEHMRGRIILGTLVTAITAGTFLATRPPAPAPALPFEDAPVRVRVDRRRAIAAA